MALQDTPRSNRLHIGIFGERNSGKSSLINSLTGQNTAIVSDVAGTTTDPVYKAMELHGLGPCVFIDTAGFDDFGCIGELRIAQTEKVIDKTDIAIMVFNAEKISGFGMLKEEDTDFLSNDEVKWMQELVRRKTPVIGVMNKIDLIQDAGHIGSINKAIEDRFKITVVSVSTSAKLGIEELKEQLIRSLPADLNNDSITGDLAKEGDVVLLVMPQDAQAPKGRLILPQVQVIRELLDKGCIIQCVTPEKLEAGLSSLKNPPKLIITDSRVFKAVYEKKPEGSTLTSFSVLLAGYKGDLDYFIKSAKAIDKLTEKSRVLIAEACTHAPLEEDIGRVKIPNMLRRRIGEGLTVDVAAGTDFPEDLSRYDLVIHCGGCMFNKKYIMTRIKKAIETDVPMTNYGVVIAYLSDILDKISL